MTVQTHKINGRVLPSPTDWAALFGADRPLILEIGFGRGDFLRHLARTQPDHNILGIEISNRCLSKAESLIAREQIANIRVIHATGEMALHHLIAPESLRAVYINFPDPWFKTGHHHRRLMQRDTLDVIVSRLQIGGELHLATDIFAYAEMSAELLAATPTLDNLNPSAWINQQPDRIITKYEANARDAGRACYYFSYRRNQTAAPPVPIMEERPMPHIVFASPLSMDQLADAFREMQLSHGDTHLHITGVYRSRGALLFETHIAEPTINQRVGIMLYARHNATPPDTYEYTLQLGNIGAPRPTDGIHAAVRLLADWMLGLHPASAVVKAKVAL